jgi:hypothetical protein
MSSFRMRQDVYEGCDGGDPNRDRIILLRSLDQADMTERIKNLVSWPLDSGGPLDGRMGLLTGYIELPFR